MDLTSRGDYCRRAFANTRNLQIDIHKSTAMDTLTVTSEETKCSLKFFPHSTLPTIDNDDGSSYFYMSKNLLVYGGGKNFLGHDKFWIAN